MSLLDVLSSNDMIYKYKLQKRLGRGGFGDVWLATDNTIDREVAVKVLDASQVSIDERLQEAKVGNHLNHQNLVKVHYADVISYNGKELVFIAMDFMPKGAVTNRLNAGNFLTLRDSVRFMIDILRGLEYLHEQEFYHNDIKPQNILIGPNNEGVLTDYGICCHAPGQMDASPRFWYRPHATPEMLTSGNINIQSDIYQVGLTLLRLVNGIGTIQDKYNKLDKASFNNLVKSGKLVRASDYQCHVPSSLRRIINKAINVTPARRYQTAVEMRRSLEGINYPGEWSCDSCGKLQGEDLLYRYRFLEIPRSNGRFDFVAKKTSKKSGRETRVADYCCSNITRNELITARERFMHHVISGR